MTTWQEFARQAPEDRYILFMLSVEFAFMNRYIDGASHPESWQPRT
jgi:hypothetical protein